MVIRPKSIDRKLGERVFKVRDDSSSVIQRKVGLIRKRWTTTIDMSNSENPWKNPDRHVKELGEIYDTELINKIQSEFEVAIEGDDHVRKISHDGEVYARQLCSHNFDGIPAFDFAENIPSLHNILNPRICRLMNEYYGTHFKPDFIKLYRNYHIPPDVVEETEIYSNYWHCDGYAIDGMKLFVNLSDVSEDHGPFHVISREDTKRLRRSGYSRSEEGVPGEKVERHAEVMKATGEAGTAMMANTNMCLHRADNPAEGNHRDLILINFLPSSEPLSENWLSDYPLDRELG